MRNITKALVAAAAVAATATALPAAAQASGCTLWQFPKRLDVYQTNKWEVSIYRSSLGRFSAISTKRSGIDSLGPTIRSQRVRLITWNADTVKFTITWGPGSEGVYNGTISPRGFMRGTSIDRFAPRNRVYWNAGPVLCRRL